MSDPVSGAFLVGSLAVSAIGTGMQFYGQQQAADNAERIAQYNYQIAEQNQKAQAQVAAQQYAWQQSTYESQYAAQQQNAAILRGQASAAEAQGREEAMRERERNQQILASQRARYAKSGVVQSEGSPLSVMAEQASILELGAQDIAYKADLQSRSFNRQADLAEYGSEFTLFDKAVSGYEQAAQEVGFQIDLNKAKLDRYAGLTSAEGMRTSSYGSLLSGFGDAINSGSNYYDRSLSRRIYKGAI